VPKLQQSRRTLHRKKETGKTNKRRGLEKEDENKGKKMKG
jgi:hypothetical protein